MKKYIKKTLAILLSVNAAFLMANTYADDAAAPTDGPLTVALLTDIDAKIPASSLAVTKMLNSLYLSYDGLFPLVTAQTVAQLDPQPVAQNTALNWTQTDVNNQLVSLSSQINNAYTNLSPGRLNTLANPYNDTLYYNLSLGLPSIDMMTLPVTACRGITCLFSQPDPTQLQQNASNFNFDSFIAPLTYTTPQQAQYAANYLTFALQTYQPLVPDNDDNTGAQNKDQSFFGKLNDYLQNHRDKADKFLSDDVLKNVDFQKYWLNLRSYAAKRSMLVSNMSYLQAERTAQPGLGAAYGLPTKDVSENEITKDLINQTINNPNWYKSMKTASPGTLQRQQLLLLSLLVRIEYHNQQLNERNLATMSVLSDTLLQQLRPLLKAQGLGLKNEIFPDKKADPNQKPQQPAK